MFFLFLELFLNEPAIVLRYYSSGIALDECEIRSYGVIHCGLEFVAST